MNAFNLSQHIEAEGMRALAPLLESFADGGRFVVTNKGPLAPMLQRTVGDILINRNGGCLGIELKTERRTTGNFFLESWSNRKFEPRKIGWMYTLLADIFWYYFLDTGLLYAMSFPRLWHWAFEQSSELVTGGKGRLFDYPEKEQTVAAQLNRTWGRCVPIATIKKEVGFEVYEPRKSLNPVIEIVSEMPSNEQLDLDLFDCCHPNNIQRRIKEIDRILTRGNK